MFTLEGRRIGRCIIVAMVSHLVTVLVTVVWYTVSVCNHTKKENDMKKLSYLWARYATPRNAKVVYVLLSLAAIAVAGGAPGAGSGAGGIGGIGS